MSPGESKTKTSTPIDRRVAGPYTVLARRYRSRSFDEIVGQEPIARTLANAVSSGRIAHAYLFCGTRGVGKTSMARILARAVNVTDDLQQADEIAEAIFRGTDLDVIEIDGASHRGINEVRDLIAAAVLSPARCRYKIYIIDEVHQVTKDAFNALLKTMEEPPAHVLFILCTTEPAKVPATVQSRCQRFDFRSLTAPQIGGQLRKILKAEGISADDDVIARIARLGRGSMRDALSLLDRLLAAGDQTLEPQLLERMLGLPDQALVARVVDAVADGDARVALGAAAALLDGGAAVDQALELLIEHLRNLMIIAACGRDCELLELSASAREAAAKQAAHFDVAGLVHLIALCDAVARNARFSAVERALFDAVIVRMCQSEHLADLAPLLEAAATGTSPKKKESLTEPVSDASPRPAEAATGVEVRPLRRGEGDSADEGSRIWTEIKAFAARTPSDVAKIEHLVYQSFDGRTLRLRVDTLDTGLARWLATQDKALGVLARQATNRAVRVELDRPLIDEGDGSGSGPSEIERARQIPIVKRASEIFDADVVDVRDSSTLRQEPENAAGSQEHV